jgi:hypothetical protein
MLDYRSTAQQNTQHNATPHHSKAKHATPNRSKAHQGTPNREEEQKRRNKQWKLRRMLYYRITAKQRTEQAYPPCRGIVADDSRSSSYYHGGINAYLIAVKSKWFGSKFGFCESETGFPCCDPRTTVQFGSRSDQGAYNVVLVVQYPSKRRIKRFSL